MKPFTASLVQGSIHIESESTGGGFIEILNPHVTIHQKYHERHRV